MNHKMSTKELRELLETRKYKTEKYFSIYNTDFDSLSEYGQIKTVFDDLLKELGRPPSQQEYIEEGVRRAEEFFKPNKGSKTASIHPVKRKGDYIYTDVCFYWNGDLIKAVKGRLARSYPSYLVEYSTIIALRELFPTFKIGSNNFVDTVFGADIVVASKEHNKVFYIHVISETKTSRDFLKEKATRKGFCKDINGNSKFYKRDWSKGHFELAFDRYKTNKTDNINGNPIINVEYIKDVIELQLDIKEGDTYTTDNQIGQFHDWLIENNVDDKGLWGLWVS